MKYPQLVSSRAVNEISDWLVKRLEELDIEHPGVYSRLLLSLLHTPFKLNALDLDDIPQLKDLKQPYHLLNKNNEELKRLAAVQSLMEVSSVEQNKANIVNLVSELHSKLRKIENSEDNSLISSKIPTTQENFSETASSVTVANQQQQQQKFYKNYKKIKRNHVVEPENPSKNYYLAFPALTVDKDKVENNKDKKPIAVTVKKPKDYSDGKVKSLCWSDVISTKDQQKRMDQTKQQFEKSTSGNSERAGGSNKSNMYFGSNKRMPKNSSSCRFFYNNNNNINNSSNNNNIEMQQHLKQMNKNYNQYSTESGSNFGQKKQSQVVKKKPKRQRNHFVFPSNINNKKSFSNKDQGKVLKKEYSSTVNSSSGNSHNISSHLEAAPVGRNNYVPYQENIVSNAPWDMDFNGQWEMDQDLIKEFIQKEKKDEKVNDAEFYNLSHDQALIIKCLPPEIMDDPPMPLSYLVEKPKQKCDDTEDNIEDIFKKASNYQITKWESDLDEAEALHVENYLQPVNVKEVQSINSFKSKFDDNVKALWDNDQNTADAGKHSLSHEMNSLSLFNWQMHQEQEQQQQQYRNENDKYFYLNVNNMDYPTTISRSTSNNSSTGEKYIKSGTNLQQSIWSDNEGKIDSAESFSNKEIYQNLYDQQTVSDDFAENGQQGEIQQVIGGPIPRFMEITYDFVPQNDFVHSESSPFQVYKPTIIKRPSKKMKSILQIAPEGVMRVVAVTTPTSSDDLLTSEKTHFCPIKSSYNDGHTFSIDYSLDSVPYERSETGSLYLNEKKFMKYKGGIRKYVLNHDYSDHEDSYYEEWEDKPRHLPNDGTFIIKFGCFSDNDKCCQTDNPQPIEFPAPKSYPSFTAAAQDFHNYHHFQKKNYISEMSDYYKLLPGNDIGNTENFSFFTTTNARNGNGLESNNYLFLTSNSSSSSISTMTSLDQPHSMPVDPFDTWRPKNDNFEGCIQSNHSLWEHCASCHESNDDGKSTTTAEGLMRDELRLDGDEIMSDLKYIQNLCITGNYEMQDTDDSEEPDEGFPENEEDFNMDDNKFYEHYYDIKKKYIIDSFVTHSNVTEDQIHIDEITLSKISNTVNEAHPNFAKYLKLFKLIKASFLNDHDDINNNLDDNVDNNLNLAKMEKNRKRRHSTCQNFLEKKYFVHPGIPVFQNEQDACVYHPGSDYWDINVKKIVMFNNEAFEINGTTGQDDSGGVNIINERKKGEDYYKQHAIIKYLDLARPLTR